MSTRLVLCHTIDNLLGAEVSSLTFSFLGFTFKNRYHIYWFPVFYDRNLDSRAHKASDSTAGKCSMPWRVFLSRLLLHFATFQLDSLALGDFSALSREAVLQTPVRGKDSHTAVLTSSTISCRATPCPVCSNCKSLWGCLLPLPWAGSPSYSLVLLWKQVPSHRAEAGAGKQAPV